MIDNFDSIKELLDFPNDDTFYDLQIIRRGKDHPNLPSANLKVWTACERKSRNSVSSSRHGLISMWQNGH